MLAHLARPQVQRHRDLLNGKSKRRHGLDLPRRFVVACVRNVLAGQRITPSITHRLARRDD